MMLASVNLSGMGGVVALPVLVLIYVTLSIAVTGVRRRRQARWLDRP